MTKNDYSVLSGLVISLFFYLLSLELPNVPIVELTMIIIFSAQYYLLMDWEEDTSKKRAHLLIIYLLEILISGIYFPYMFVFFPVYFFAVPFNTINFIFLSILLFIYGLMLGHNLYTVFFITGLCLIISFVQSQIRNNRQSEIKTFNELSSLRFKNERMEGDQKLNLELQDERVNNSILMERKRIVGEIHDLLGHQLSSSIIQIAALEYMVEDEAVKVRLKEINEVLNDSMTNIRSVIHSERETAVNMEREINNLIKQFTKARVIFSYRNNKPLSNQLTHSIVTIVTEALTNINKHSDATEVKIRFIELEDKWTLLISDNGESIRGKDINLNSTGIGLLTMEERVRTVGGTIFISNDNGFRIFITIPIEEAIE